MVSDHHSSFFDGVAGAIVYGDGRKYIYRPSDGRLTRFDLIEDPEERAGLDVPPGQEFDETVRRLNSFLAYQQLRFLDSAGKSE